MPVLFCIFLRINKYYKGGLNYLKDKIMSDFAVVVYSKKVAGQVEYRRLLLLLKKLWIFIKNILSKEKPNITLETIELYEDVKINIITLPYTLEELKELKSTKIKGITENINNICNSVKAAECIFPKSMEKIQITNSDTRNSDRCRRLYKALVKESINRLYLERNAEINALEVVIVQGDNNHELLTIINIILPLFKYITVLSSDRASLNDETGRIYSETGISIILSNDFRHGLKNADFIINLSNDNEKIFNGNVNRKAIILNYGRMDFAKVTTESIFITGINFELPQEVISKIKNNIYEFYKKHELVELIVLNKFENCCKCDYPNIDNVLVESISKEFRRCGFKISSFKGRHNILNLNDIRKYT
jgi:hypothetical protein